MAEQLSGGSGGRLTPTQWLVCVLCAIGFAFDIYELLMLPLILRPALLELGNIRPNTPEFRTWYMLLFYVPAFAGGIFGLLGGYLTDRLGRRRVLTWSILVYAFSAFAAGFSTSLPMLLFFRCTTFVGVCVEFVAAVAWLAELFADRNQREAALGYTQAFSSLGGLMVASVNGVILGIAGKLPAIAIPEWLSFIGTIGESHAHEAWRYTLMSGLIPALPLIVIRPFLPESPQWKAKKTAGTLRRPRIAELFAPALRKTTIVTTIMFACSYGAAFGAIQHLPQIVPGWTEVKEQTAGKPVPMQKEIEQKTYNPYMKVQEIGGLVGRFLLAVLAIRILSRRRLLRVFQLPGLILMPLAFYAFGTIDNRTLLSVESLHLNVTLFHVAIFVCGLVTVAQFSFWGNYLPRMYPIHLRGTGESFAANIGGRMIGTSFAAVTTVLAGVVPKAFSVSEPVAWAMSAAAVALFVYAAGSIACFWLPEPREGELPE